MIVSINSAVLADGTSDQATRMINGAGEGKNHWS